jgi:hypothetical protein
MYPMHPEFRNGLAEEHARRLAEDMQAASYPGVTRRFAARLLLVASRRRARGEALPDQASSASLTSRSASSLCSRRTAA